MIDHGRIGSVEQSRRMLLDEIGEAPDLTFVRGYGNVGDELIWAGTRQLLAGHVYREIGIEELASSGGEAALLCGGGAFSRAYNEYMPEALAIAELRFDRVIVLPSSFEVEEDRVRDVLSRSRATVFAREHESYRRIAGRCRARVAHDCAFFFDFSEYVTPGAGTGTLEAFRTDRERGTSQALPASNHDISAACETLEQWLAVIARHAVVRTDRAHVMIAAALMGKEVRYRSSSSFKLDAIAAACLQGLPVHKLDGAAPDGDSVAAIQTPMQRATRERLRAAAMGTPAPARVAGRATTRVTVAIVSRDRPGEVVRAIESALATSLPVRILVLDQNSGPQTRAALQAIAAAHANVDVRLADRNLGCAGGRKLAVELTDTELVLFLDDDAELMPGAIEHMVADLDDHPEAAVVTALVVFADGNVYHFGGWVRESSEIVSFDLHGAGRPFDDPALLATGPSGWAPGTAALIRRRLFDAVPIDDAMAAYFEDNDWCRRVEQHRPGSFRRCREALAMHAQPAPPAQATTFVERAHAVRQLAAQARFLRTHGVLLDNGLLALMPALQRPDGSPDLPAARLLLEIVAARGTDWTLMEWMNGGLDPLLHGGRRENALLRLELEALRDRHAALDEHARALGARAEQAEAHAGERQALRHDNTLLRQQLEALREEATMLHRHVNVTAIETRRLHDQLAALDAHARALGARAEQAEDHRRDRQAELAWLQQRHETLVRIEDGGWWRLRARLMPARRAVLRLRRVVRRGDGGP